MSRIPFNQWFSRVTALLMAFAALSWSHIARSDAVLDWNAIAVNTISTASPPRPGPVGPSGTNLTFDTLLEALKSAEMLVRRGYQTYDFIH
jgi:hypothetical protein